MKHTQGGMTVRHAIGSTLGALSLALPLIAMAQQQQQQQQSDEQLVTVTRLTPAQAAKVSALKKDIKSTAAQRAAVDENGRLRPLEHDEMRAAEAMQKTKEAVKRNASTSTMAAQASTQAVYHANGAVGQGFDPDSLSFAKATVSKNGKLEESCDETSHEGHTHAATATKGAK
jgi:hypothetical protein